MLSSSAQDTNPAEMAHAVSATAYKAVDTMPTAGRSPRERMNMGPLSKATVSADSAVKPSMGIHVCNEADCEFYLGL